jgi:hypothetical protein
MKDLQGRFWDREPKAAQDCYISNGKVFIHEDGFTYDHPYLVLFQCGADQYALFSIKKNGHMGTNRHTDLQPETGACGTRAEAAVVLDRIGYRYFGHWDGGLSDE